VDGPRKPFKRQGGLAADRGRPGARGLGARGRGAARPAEHEGDAARACVMEALTRQLNRYPDLALNVLDTGRLDDRDAAFAHALYDAVIRRWLTLTYLIDRLLTRPDEPPPPKPAAALLAGAAQILLLDKVPVHAAVDTSVEWVKRSGGEGPSRLVNAVLRAVATLVPESGKAFRPACADARDELPMPDGTALVLAEPVLPADPLSRLAVVTSTPIELLRSWAKHRSLREARRLALHGLVQPPTILNTAHARAPLPDSCVPHALPGHHVWTDTHTALSELLRDRRDLWVQDPASSLAVSTSTDVNPSLIVDPCAGMGTKTRQLAATFPNARLIAADVDMVRVKALRQSVDAERVTVVPYQSLIDYAGQADLVLLDVPCSNTGVLARRVEARYRFDREHLESLTATQRQIIADSMRLLKRGGRLLYSSCSLDPAENQEQAKWTSRWHGLRVVREHDRLPEGLPGDGPERYTDGSYAASME
jgi:16S rRNA (cytosine967-C5)-methyltransferase